MKRFARWVFVCSMVLLVLAIVIVIVAPEPEEEPVAAADVTVSGTPTAEEALREFTVCQKLQANLSLYWGQAPGTIYAGDPRTSGQIEAGDFVKFLTPPNSEGQLRVQVFPHDGRAVGNTEDKVWISWAELIRHRSDQDMFSCIP